jgi:DNA-binding transcriptional ArsR family regulator
LRDGDYCEIVEEMNDSDTKSAVGEPPKPSAELPKLDPLTVLSALGGVTRWSIVQLLADGRELTISGVAAVVGGTAENISKQLAVLRNAGVVEWKTGEDRRQSVFYIPAARRPAPGVLDYGFCRIDLKLVKNAARRK